jgi:hypothetical protein
VKGDSGSHGDRRFLTHSRSPPVLRSILFLSSMGKYRLPTFLFFPPSGGAHGTLAVLAQDSQDQGGPAQDPFLLNQGSTLDDAHPALGTIVFIHVCFPFPAVFLWPRLFARLSRRSKRTRSHSIYHSTKTQPQPPVATHRLTISSSKSRDSRMFPSQSVLRTCNRLHRHVGREGFRV